MRCYRIQPLWPSSPVPHSLLLATWPQPYWPPFCSGNMAGSSSPPSLRTCCSCHADSLEKAFLVTSSRRVPPRFSAFVPAALFLCTLPIATSHTLSCLSYLCLPDQNAGREGHRFRLTHCRLIRARTFLGHSRCIRDICRINGWMIEGRKKRREGDGKDGWEEGKDGERKKEGGKEDGRKRGRADFRRRALSFPGITSRHTDEASRPPPERLPLAALPRIQTLAERAQRLFERGGLGRPAAPWAPASCRSSAKCLLPRACSFGLASGGFAGGSGGRSPERT